MAPMTPIRRRMAARPKAKRPPTLEEQIGGRICAFANQSCVCRESGKPLCSAVAFRARTVIDLVREHDTAEDRKAASP